jgi:hypothetical protein
MDHGDGQEHALGGEPSCGHFNRHVQTRGAQAQPMPHAFRSLRG